MNLQITIKSVNGIAYNQTISGDVLCHVSPTNAEQLRDELIRVVEAINLWMIMLAESKKNAVQARQQLPPSPAQVAEAELERMRLAAQVTERLRVPAPPMVPTPGLPPAFTPADGATPEDQAKARAQTVVGGGVIMASEDLGPPPDFL